MSKMLKINRIVMIGIDHKLCPIEFREKLCFSDTNLSKAYNIILSENNIKETIILSTCNRSEIYAFIEPNFDFEKYITKFYSLFFEVDLSIFKKFYRIRSGKECIKHIFEVSCGLKSLVLGEDQILGQVKNAYQNALMNNSSKKVLSRMFLDCISTSKKIKTCYFRNSMSISSISLDMIEENLANLTSKTALVIGLGKMSKQSIYNLHTKGIMKMFVTNRTRGKTENLVQSYSELIQIEFKDRYKIIDQVDIIISCTSAPHFILTKEKFDLYYKGGSLQIIDMAIPRDIDPHIADHKAINLIRVDDLDCYAKQVENIKLEHRSEIESIIKANLKTYVKWLEETEALESIYVIKDYSDQIMLKELTKLKKKLGNIDKNQMKIIEKSFENFAKSFIHKPIIKAKEFHRKDNGYKDIFHEVFSLEDNLL